jgi:hypothetical protein
VVAEVPQPHLIGEPHLITPSRPLDRYRRGRKPCRQSATAPRREQPPVDAPLFIISSGSRAEVTLDSGRLHQITVPATATVQQQCADVALQIFMLLLLFVCDNHFERVACAKG